MENDQWWKHLDVRIHTVTPLKETSLYLYSERFEAVTGALIPYPTRKPYEVKRQQRPLAVVEILRWPIQTPTNGVVSTDKDLGGLA